MRLPLMNLVKLNGMSILRQLHLEEKLMRTSSENWCIINDGTIKPTIVMGISGKPQELLETESVLRDEIPVIRRRSGGGTVIVDQDTVFVTFICNKDAVPGLKPDPQRIIHWTGHLYEKVFNGIGNFSVCENDYVLGGRKFGGNALSITSKRWLQHTSFLWDYKKSNMSYLKLPQKAPNYRQGRSHLDFICRMKDYISRSDFIDETIRAAESHFRLTPLNQEDSLLNQQYEHSRSRLLTVDELEEAPVYNPAVATRV